MNDNTGFGLDPIDLGVMWDRLVAISDEVLQSIVRTAFSVGVREAFDLACVLFDARGRAIAQASLSMPAFIGTAPLTMGHMLARYPAREWRPGDVVVTNDPWLGTGHTPDLCVARPLFAPGAETLDDPGLPLGFVMTISHLPDIGGPPPSITARQSHEEGLILPVCRLYRRGRPVRELMDLIALNVRGTDQVFGDIEANVAGGALAERLMAEFMSEYGLDRLDALADGVIGQSARAIRAEISKIPNGVYAHAMEVEALDDLVRLAVEITITDDSVHADFTGTGPAVPLAINVPLCYTRSFLTYAVKSLTIPQVPNNHGALAPISLSAPEGCILNAPRPAATMGRHTIGWFIVPLIMGALAKALPDRVQAESGMASLILLHGRRPDGRPVSGQYFLAGGLGAMSGRDGRQTTPFPTNNAVVSSEVFETETGLSVLRRALLADSGGAGQYRGGPGQIADIRNDSGHDYSFSFFGLRTRVAAAGLQGGAAGRCRRYLVDGKEIPGKGRIVLAPGQILTIEEAGGGGFGPTSARDQTAIRADLAAGFISPAGARRDYGPGGTTGQPG